MKWLFPSDVSVSDALAQAVGGHPLVAEILVRRGICNVDEALAFLNPERYTPAPPDALPDLDIAAGRLLEAVGAGEHILVWGDFDVDGQSATSLLVEALRGLGARVSYHIPHRLKHGHGVQVEVLREYLAQGVDLVLTCDTGVAAHEAAEAARSAGATLLITDHHALPEALPNAPAVVNPQRLPSGHPLRDLPGVGVAYKLVEQLYRLAGREGNEHRLLDLVALGIVADVATQQGDTRYLLQLGIDMLRYPHRVGLQALMAAAQVDPSNLSSDTIGYQVGPRLNALGRLDDASLAVELLTTQDRDLAQQIAVQLELYNERRRQIEDQIYAAAQEQITGNPSLLEFDALVLEGEQWHPGVIGIVAARLVEQYQRPVVLLSAPPGEVARGSARSVPGVDIGAAIAANADLLIRYGGHPGAAGCMLDADLIPQFRRRLSNTVRETRDPNAIDGLRVDAVVTLDGLSMELAQELNRLSPFGAGNPPVHLMVSGLRVVTDALFGVGSKHRRITVEDARGNSQVVTWWRGSEHPLPHGVFDLLLIPRVSDYKGKRALQLEWVDSRPTPGVPVEVGLRYQVVDLRAARDPLLALPPDGYRVWAEAVSEGELPFDPAHLLTRDIAGPLPAGIALVIWTAPPGLSELEQMLEQTRPRRVFVVARHTPASTPEGFLKWLGGLVNYALRRYGGQVSVLKLAAAAGQREATIRRGLDWMVAKGQISLEWLDGDHAQIARGGTPALEMIAPLQDAIRALLAEAAAFRAYFRQADLRGFFDG